MTDEYPRGFEPEKSRVSIIDAARKHVEAMVVTWDTDTDDIHPALFYRRWDGEITFVAIMADMNSGRVKDMLAETITARIVIDGATEAVFISSAWMVESTSADRSGQPMPVDHPDRVEIAFLAHKSPDGPSLHRAVISGRVPGSGKPPVLQPWEELPGVEMGGGRFDEAINHGLRAARMTPRALIDSMRIRCGGDEDKLTEMLLHAMRDGRDSARKHEKEHPEWVFGCQLCQARRSAGR